MAECWMVCEDNWERARDRGYDELSSVLRTIFGNESVSYRLSRGDLRGRIKSRQYRRGTLVIVGHRTDLSAVAADLSGLRAIDGLNLIELQFTTASVGDDTEGGFAHDGMVPYCSIRRTADLIAGAAVEEFASQKRLNEWVEKRRAETQQSMLDPLLPLAVLIDGYLAFPAASNDWFKAGVEAAVSTSGSGRIIVGTDAYWNDLRGCKAAVERIQKALGRSGELPRGSTAVLMVAREYGWSGRELDPSVEANELYRNACDAVKSAWQQLTSNEEMPRGEETLRLIEAASVGFHVLAVGHL